MADKLTKPQRQALEWFGAREFASHFGVSDPSLTTVRRLRDKGLLRSNGNEPGFFGFVRYSITDAGRAALAAAKGQS